MTRLSFDAVCRVLTLIRTPLALEVLEDLAHDRSPYQRGADNAVITAAVDYLRSIGAVTSAPQPTDSDRGPVEITRPGRVLFWRLVEIEAMAAQEELDDDQAA